MSDRLYFPVPDECDNMLAQRFLRDKCGLSARIITRLKREKDGILMDGKILRTIDCVQSGKTVSIAIPDEKCEIEPTKGTLDIRYEDEHFLVVNKPHSMPVHPVKQHQSDTLANIVSYYCSQNGKPFVFRAINRLDKDTSGLVLIAKNRFTANAVKNKTHKVYYALCEGEINIEGIVYKPMDLRDDSKMVRIVRDDGMKAVTHYKPLVATKDFTLLELWLETGRTHQIRCHMAYLGHPLMGDDLYGGKLDKISRQALHCARLEFYHPIKNEYITVTAEIPEDMQSVINNKED